MVRAEEKWSACMAKRGFRYADPGDIEGEHRAALHRHRRRRSAARSDGATRSRDELRPRRAVRLQRDEVKVANADLACEKQEITPVELVVRPQYEEVFRKQNRTLLVRVKPLGQVAARKFVAHGPRLTATLACEPR